MKVPRTITLKVLGESFADWRQTRKSTNQPVPSELRKLTAEALYHFSVKEIMTATLMVKKRVISFWDEFFPDLELKEMQTPKDCKSKAPPVVHFSEVVVSPPPVSSKEVGGKPSTLIASIDDRFGRSLKIFSDAANPSILIQSFLSVELEVVQ